VSENDSFIDEVTEEVRRDKLYLFFKKYVWVLVLVILSVILASIFIEIRSNAKQASAEMLGDVLYRSLNNTFENAQINESDQEKFIDSKSVVALILEAKVLENNSKFKLAITSYETILNINELPNSLKDFVKFKLLMLIKDNPTRVESLLAELINPDSSFNLLALEQKALIKINDEQWKQAISILNILIESPEASQAMISRATQLKKAIKLDSL
jgi:hypothetical protein